MDSERDCARRVSRRRLVRAGALGLFRTPLTGRTLLRLVCDTARFEGVRCSYPLIENDFGNPDDEPVTLLSLMAPPRARPRPSSSPYSGSQFEDENHIIDRMGDGCGIEREEPPLPGTRLDQKALERHFEACLRSKCQARVDRRLDLSSVPRIPTARAEPPATVSR